MHPAPRLQPAGVLLHDIEPLWDNLLRTWLEEGGLQIVREAPQLLITGQGYPRRQGPAIATLRTLWPGTPILLLSPTIHAGAAAQGPLAQQLGVQAALPMPAPREALLAVVQQLLVSNTPEQR